ncbi:non-functional NADPH-dependent codeinone reductase 2-like [Euphorbia lathyris]|uniref:non-functional NADPH-dependent codeinone reductase 2-like n=1 Tax=Euphorbia lathyris TaxID=212925 RepID=UPI003313D59F
MAKIPNVKIGGTDFPLIGFGTAGFPFGEDEEAVKQSVLNAIEAGYRHFDTASAYQSEKAVGDAIVEALKLGLIKSRDELFITSKLFSSDTQTHLVLPAIRKSLKNLGLEYLDLYLIHFPVSFKEGSSPYGFKPEDILELDIESVWKSMEECQKLGLTKAIGVSNFTRKKIEKLLATASIIPFLNQVEMNPCWQQKKLKEFCEEKGIHTTAYSPLGGKGTPWGTNQVMDCEVLKEIAISRGKTLAQICLRWIYEQNVSVVVKSFNKQRIKENLEIFDWELSEEDLQKIDQIPQERGQKADFLVNDVGPFKTLMDLWDGEM